MVLALLFGAILCRDGGAIALCVNLVLNPVLVAEGAQFLCPVFKCLNAWVGSHVWRQ